ncbi:MAG TPA: helicase, partial [Afipia sp.]|nr:helicase [Afipia sp.]
ARGAPAVERLWEACQIPDYRKLSPAAHAELVTTLYGFLMRKGRIPDNWFEAQIAQTDRTDGDIDTLSARIAQIRTWTFAANRPDWLVDPERWQAIARAVEDKLSDALHERLTERFVDRRTSVLMRRLRENTMLNTEIGKTGEVIVEGHMIGRLDGFMFAPESAEAGSDAKALQAAALKALAGEIDARAEKLSKAPDEQFVLASDGTLRWTGDAVAKLVAADDALHPRIRIIADERLTGPSREAVQTRLDLWLKTHIEKILGPMFELSKAEDVTGIARGIAFQLIEALGVLERPKIAAEMKDLDQPSRASLRKYGVRFGAYHIFLPALLKPAARGLASLLWGLKRDNVDWSALTGAQHLAASGRTSFPADKALDQEAYRTLGYKLCGDRAVRVDILERLADLIRPALSWRPGSPGDKPAGAFDGRSFTATQAMTSLTGSAGEDFASILKALGYRMEKRPPLPEVVAPPVAAETVADATAETADTASVSDAVVAEPEVAAATDSIADVTNDATTEAVPSAESVSTDTSASRLPEVNFAPPSETSEPVAEAAAETSSEPAVVAEATETAAVEAPAGEAGPDQAATEAAVSAEPVLVEVWRPGGRSDERRPRHDRSRYKGPDKSAAPAAEGEAASGDDKRERHGRHRRDRNNEHRRPRPDAPAVAAEGADAAQARPPRDDKGGRPREGFKGKDRNQERGKGKFDKRGRDGRKDDRDRSGGSHRTYATSATPRERDRPADPNSPFAKLAALKEQLAGNRKE